MTAAQPPAGAVHRVHLPFPLQPDETVIALYRRHWWFLWPQSIILTLAAVVPVGVVAWLLSLAGVLGDAGVFFWAPAALWFGYWGVRLFFNWYRYRNDIWVVTDQRIIDSVKPHPFNMRVSTADLINIQDMSVQKSGIAPSLLNFGDVICETASAESVVFRITGVPHPEEIQLLIDRERDLDRQRHQ